MSTGEIIPISNAKAFIKAEGEKILMVQTCVREIDPVDKEYFIKQLTKFSWSTEQMYKLKKENLCQREVKLGDDGTMVETIEFKKMTIVIAPK